jgi:hypothetical protein
MSDILCDSPRIPRFSFRPLSWQPVKPQIEENSKHVNEIEDPVIVIPHMSPTVIPAPWLPVVERRLQNSIAPRNFCEAEDDGSWIGEKIANTAIDFFQETSDLLPSEPYIYSSQKGDLVAEHDLGSKKLTNIIGESFVLTFLFEDGEITKKEFDITEKGFNEIRESFKNLKNTLPPQYHGVLETKTR